MKKKAVKVLDEESIGLEFATRGQVAQVLRITVKTLMRKIRHKPYFKEIPNRALIPPELVKIMLMDLRCK